ncbi:PRTRC system protein E [Ralstonia nicotianae]|uniref:PRTRC system protein E n=1 Tax=Ralstonia pseudosolanacearum TaxID=1310165 RepID=UPI002005AF69|nr:PRTRC system protein E [Ralstonia pseudosolanacearum]MCK4118363.1 PRTRC system protein E [Ralstonia pseudosolanacearum]
MFQALTPLVQASDRVVFTLSMQGEQMKVVVAPVVSKPDDVALATPIALIAKPAELDAGFAQALADYTQARCDLREQVEATKAVLSAAAAKQSSKATKALAKANKGAAQATLAASDADDADDSDELDLRQDAGAEVPPAAVAPASALDGTNLADLLG